jgi:NAD(P)-dependent dehydrogenase (short-subunit alcohol dehydrogenase family)
MEERAHPLRVLVTGAGRGIGRAIALRFARPGARIVAAARTRSELESLVGELEGLGAHGLALVMDVADEASVRAGMQRALAFTGGALDVLVNNAGIFTVAPFEELELGTWRRLMAVNLEGPMLVTKAALDALRGGQRPHLFNIGSSASRQPFSGSSAYCATKYGLKGLTDVLRLELAPDVRVSSVYPGATDTTIFDGVPGEWDRSRMNRPEDVAEVVWRGFSADAGTPVDDLVVPPPA